MAEEIKEELKETPKETLFTQAQVNSFLKREVEKEVKNKYSDYDQVKSKLSEYEQQQDVLKQKELEERKQYDQLRDQWNKKENEYKTVLSQKDQEITQERISNALSSEILTQNAYPDAIDLLKTSAVYENGTIKIKGKDSNGMEQLLPLSEGVKQFLSQKPYLVKSVGNRGSGTPPSGTGGTLPEGSLAEQLIAAQKSGNRAKVNEIKNAIRAKHSSSAKV